MKKKTREKMIRVLVIILAIMIVAGLLPTIFL